MIKVVLAGAGKMGISHLAILAAHPDVKIAGVCDSSKMVTDALQKFTSFPCYHDFDKMLEETSPDAVFVAVPTKSHATMIKKIITRGIHVFTEKPLSLSPAESLELAELADQKNIVNQVGYHNKFIGTFVEIKRIIEDGYLGNIFHFTGEAYGPVVTRPRQETWRSDPSEGGGCLFDYASHVIDLINYIIGPVTKAKGTVLKSLYSKKVEDAVYSIIELSNNISGILSVNWSDDTHRKMTTSLTVQGSNGKIMCDANELKVYFKTENCPASYSRGWNVKHVTDLTKPVAFYLRGEEYSAQIDYFIQAVKENKTRGINSFNDAYLTDYAISLIKQNAKE